MVVMFFHCFKFVAKVQYYFYLRKQGTIILLLRQVNMLFFNKKSILLDGLSQN